jgi:hypothetical protein
MEAAKDLVHRAREFAVGQHTLIGHRRKYTKLPYSEHLKNVAHLVASVTDDEEMIAAAWLHDVVEDTTATLEDVEGAFGKGVAGLVEWLTDVSRPGDGNRVARKAIDRAHLARADRRAKTIKLADLIDNCEDIVKHDPRFGKVYLQEMGALLMVLDEGDPRLHEKATRLYTHWAEQLAIAPPAAEDFLEDPLPGLAAGWQAYPHLTRLFLETFRAQDIAEPLRSFDADRPCAEVLPVLENDGIEVIGIRVDGVIRGYARPADLTDGRCGDHFRPFRTGQVIRADDPLMEVIHVLTSSEYVFLTAFREVAGVVQRSDVNKPVTRMWLFGIVILGEMELTRLIDVYFPSDSWQALVPAGRIEKAVVLQEERGRRHQPCRLVQCLQFSDKFQLLLEHPEGLRLLGMESRRAGRKIIKELESLRNNLAHGQDIVTHDWAPIARMAARLSEAGARPLSATAPIYDNP